LKSVKKTKCFSGRLKANGPRRSVDIHYVSKNIPDIFDCNLKTNYQNLITFGKNISDTTG